MAIVVLITSILLLVEIRMKVSINFSNYSNVNKQSRNTVNFKEKFRKSAQQADSPKDIATSAMLGGFLLSHYDIFDYIKEGKGVFNKSARTIVVAGVLWLVYEELKKLFENIKEDGFWSV